MDLDWKVFHCHVAYHGLINDTRFWFQKAQSQEKRTVQHQKLPNSVIFRASDAHVDHLDVSDTWGNSEPQNAAIALMNMFIKHWISDDFGTIGFWLPLFSCFPMCSVIFRWPSSHFETNCHLSQWAATAPHPRPQVDANESGAGRERSEAPEGFVWKYVISYSRI